jgi:dihydrofolate reductase
MTKIPPIGLVVAVARNGVIGRANSLPWRLPNDLAHFKRLTLGRPIVMGRRTWDSLGRPLPGRRNVVLTRDRSFGAEGAEVVHDLEGAYALADSAGLLVIGGGELYRLCLPLAETLHLTTVEADVDGDVLFPPWNPAEWTEVAAEPHPADERHAFPYTFRTLRRR